MVAMRYTKNMMVVLLVGAYITAAPLNLNVILLNEMRDKMKLIHGDCLQEMFDIPDNSVDMVCCDMPYGSTQNKWDTILPLDMLWHHYERLCTDSGVVVLNSMQPFTSMIVLSKTKWFKYIWVWNKINPTGHLNAKKQPMRKTEDICVFYRKQPTYNPQGLKWNPRVKSRSSKTEGSNCYGSHGDCNMATWQGYPTNLIEIKNENGLHPTQKPVALIEYLIKTYTNEGDTVLDNCMGSGTTGVACKNLGRNFIGIEIDAEYFEIAKQRIEGTQYNQPINRAQKAAPVI